MIFIWNVRKVNLQYFICTNCNCSWTFTFLSIVQTWCIKCDDSTQSILQCWKERSWLICCRDVAFNSCLSGRFLWKNPSDEQILRVLHKVSRIFWSNGFRSIQTADAVSRVCTDSASTLCADWLADFVLFFSQSATLVPKKMSRGPGYETKNDPDILWLGGLGSVKAQKFNSSLTSFTI